MRTLAICLALSLFHGPLGAQEKPKSKRRILVFQDITLSMAGDEAKAAQDVVDELLARMPGGSEIAVIPICENTENAPGEFQVVPIPAGVSKLAVKLANEERQRVKAAFAEDIRAIRDDTDAARKDYSSCISPALYRAKRMLAEPDNRKKIAWSTDVIIVSDMIEECQTSLLGKTTRLKLTNGQFDEAVKLLDGKIPAFGFPDDVRVIVMLPKAVSTAVRRSDQPSGQRLEDFWRRLFAKSGVRDVWWDASPQRYLDSIGAKRGQSDKDTSSP